MEADSFRGAGCRAAEGRDTEAGNPAFHVCNLRTWPKGILAQGMRRECPPLSG